MPEYGFHRVPDALRIVLPGELAQALGIIAERERADAQPGVVLFHNLDNPLDVLHQEAASAALDAHIQTLTSAALRSARTVFRPEQRTDLDVVIDLETAEHLLNWLNGRYLAARQDGLDARRGQDRDSEELGMSRQAALYASCVHGMLQAL